MSLYLQLGTETRSEVYARVLYSSLRNSLAVMACSWDVEESCSILCSKPSRMGI